VTYKMGENLHTYVDRLKCTTAFEILSVVNVMPFLYKGVEQINSLLTQLFEVISYRYFDEYFFVVLVFRSQLQQTSLNSQFLQHLHPPLQGQ